jgi:hypothetical protein
MGRRVAVLGLYNSGSTAVAGVLHRLGVNMGPPFWASSRDGAADNYYEPHDLAWHLRRWWHEPELAEHAAAEHRVRFLRCWADLQEAAGPAPVGAKHPLLSLCGPDLVAAWGPGTAFVWAWRPLAESVAGLKRRGWFAGSEWSLQGRLWDALAAFERTHPGVVRLDWGRVRADPPAAARELAALAGVDPSGEQLRSAAAFVRP